MLPEPTFKKSACRTSECLEEEYRISHITPMQWMQSGYDFALLNHTHLHS